MLFDFEEIIGELNKQRIRYILVGGRAAVFYGSPRFTYDYDFWVHPEDKNKLFDLFENEFGFEPSRGREEKRPIFVFYSDSGDKVDVFIARKITNKDGETISIDECLANSKEIREPKSDFFVRVPSIDDLIKLKKMGKRPKDIEDIEYLETIKRLRKRKILHKRL
ncbi:MAG: hypothetical protein HY754_03290 [Nitrospirae bacterium]|nr:hypothetical protein [Nitrospirota bacterium]